MKTPPNNAAGAGRSAMTCSARRFRVVRAPNIWTDSLHYYPEERPRWWPFWFRFDSGEGTQVFFLTEPEAWKFIARVRPQNS